MVTVDITRDERRKLWAVAKELYKQKYPTAMEKYKLDGRHPVLRDYEGFLGESAVAKYLGLPYEAEIFKHKGDNGTDLVYGSIRIGVKASTFQPKPLLLVKKNEKKADVYFLVELFKATGEIRIAGWLDRETIVARQPKKVHTNGPLNHVFAYDELRSMEEWEHGLGVGTQVGFLPRPEWVQLST